MVYDVRFIWGALGDALSCVGFLGWLAGPLWQSLQFGCLEDGAPLCDVVYLEGEEWSSLRGLRKICFCY